MVQLVFIHGVSTRSGPAYDKARSNFDTLIEKVAFKDRQVTIRHPVWGDLVPERAWDGASFPRIGEDPVGSFSLTEGLGAAIVPANPGRPLAATAAHAPG